MEVSNNLLATLKLLMSKATNNAFKAGKNY